MANLKPHPTSPRLVTHDEIPFTTVVTEVFRSSGKWGWIFLLDKEVVWYKLIQFRYGGGMEVLFGNDFNWVLLKSSLWWRDVGSKFMVIRCFPIASLTNWGMVSLLAFGIIVGWIQLLWGSFFHLCMMFSLLHLLIWWIWTLGWIGVRT